MSAQPHILIVDDEECILQSLHKIFDREGYQCTTTDNGAVALEHLRQHRVDVVLADIMMPKMSGLELLRTIKVIAPAVEVIMMTAFGTIEKAVECMRAGSYDFIAKPLRRAIVVRSVQRALERGALVRENADLRDAVQIAQEGGDIIGKSPAMRRTLDRVAQAAPSAATILLTGDSGTGKELLARRLHRLSERAQKAFVAVNCAALPDSLLESELFGHEKGSFTGATQTRRGFFERAHTGTLFLDEIGETSPAVQVRLLRALQEGEIERVGSQGAVSVDVRIIAATHRDLEQDVTAGRFREDLYYRLNVVDIHIPRLLERQGDVVLLAQYFMQRYATKNSKTMRGFSEAALKALDAYDWPGNVRQLENTIERAVVLCRSEYLGIEDLPEAITEMHSDGAVNHAAGAEGMYLPFGSTLEDLERHVIRETLKRTGGDKNTTARVLGITARTIYRKLEAS